MNGKKLFALLLALCLTLTLAACGGKDGEEPPAEVTPGVATPEAQDAPSPAPTPDGTPAPDAAPESEPEPKPEPEATPEPEPEWEPDWTLLDFTEVAGAARFIRERYDDRWSNVSGDSDYFGSETLTAYDEEGRVLFERVVDSDGYACESVYAYGVPCYEYDYETYINSTRFRSNQGDDTRSEDVYETVTDVLFRTEISGTDGLRRIDYEYDTKGNLTRELTVIPTEEEHTPVCYRAYTYDTWTGALIREVYEEDAGTKIVTEYEYERLDLLCERTTVTDEYGGKSSRETKYEYNESGDVAAQETVSSEGVERWEYAYDEDTGGVSRIAFSGLTNYVETRTYTGWGDVESVRTEYLDDPEVDVAEYEYDVECRLVRLRETIDYGAAREERVTSYSYEFAD